MNAIVTPSSLKTLAYGWHLMRRDGVALGFTSHDHDQIVGGVHLSAQPGLAPTKIVSTLGTQSDGLDIDGAFTADALREDDLGNGRWDGAKMHIFLYDWNDLSADIQTLARGELGEVRQSNGAFTAEFLGLTAQLDHEVAPVTSPTCRARFGDHHCKLNRQRFAHILRVERVMGNRLMIDGPIAGDISDFAFGELRWLTGPATGLSTYILDSDTVSLTLVEIPPIIATISQDEILGYRVEAIMGCNKSISTCSNRFQNSVNFRGEPYLPGNDLLTRYPGLN